MEMLLKISTTPTEYEIQVQHAKLSRTRSSPPVLEMTREKGGLKISNQPAKINIDTFEARNSVCPTLKTAIYQAAQKGFEAAGALAQQYASETSQMRWSKVGEGGEMLNKIFTQRAQMPTGDFMLDFIPSTGAQLTYQPGDLSMEYQMDRLSFDLKVNNGNVEYIPGSVELVITQFADINIEYIGDPIYVPPSAGERFLGKELDVTA